MGIGPLMTAFEAAVIVTVSTLAVILLIFCAVMIIDAATGAFFSRERYNEKTADKANTTSDGIDP